MRFYSLIVCLGLSVSIAGCQIHQVRGEVGGVDVQAQTKEDHSNPSNSGQSKPKDNNRDGEFCPPGQAKKGKC